MSKDSKAPNVGSETVHPLVIMAILNDVINLKYFIEKVEAYKGASQPVSHLLKDFEDGLNTAIAYSSIEVAVNIITASQKIFGIKIKDFIFDKENTVFHLAKEYKTYDPLIESLNRVGNFKDEIDECLKIENAGKELPSTIKTNVTEIGKKQTEKSKYENLYLLDLRFSGEYVLCYDNETASLFDDKEITTLSKKPLEDQLQALKPLITEHCARRADFFFYTLLAFYKKKIKLTHDEKDIFQHGGGKVSGYAPCHSSLYGRFKQDPEVKDEFVIRNSVGKQHKKSAKSILDGTYFIDALNSTVQLPGPAINTSFDYHQIEKHLRKDLMVVVNAASAGTINPFQGMVSFFLIMEKRFDTIKNKYLTEKSPISPGSKKIMYDAAIAGTFEGWYMTKDGKGDSTPITGYGYLLDGYKEMLLFHRSKSKAEEDRFIEIQKEIYENKSNFLLSTK